MHNTPRVNSRLGKKNPFHYIRLEDPPWRSAITRRDKIRFHPYQQSASFLFLCMISWHPIGQYIFFAEKRECLARLPIFLQRHSHLCVFTISWLRFHWGVRGVLKSSYAFPCDISSELLDLKLSCTERIARRPYKVWCPYIANFPPSTSEFDCNSTSSCHAKVDRSINLYVSAKSLTWRSRPWFLES